MIKGGTTMNFFNRYATFNKLENTVFGVLEKYQKDTHPDKINATIGSLCDEENKLVSFESIYKTFRNLANTDYTKYPQGIIGNQDYRQLCFEHCFENLVHLKHQEVATNGGTGALHLAFHSYLNEGDSLLVPEICWDSYHVMAKQRQVKIVEYPVFDLECFQQKAQSIIETEGKLVVLINDPAHNPTGYSLGQEKWEQIISFLNQFTETPIIIIHDIAYIDYCQDRNFFTSFNKAKEHILFHVAVSMSKGFTMYGQRIGLAAVFNQSQGLVDKCLILFEKLLRASVSCCNNAAMKTIATTLANHKQDYQQELTSYRKLIRQRANLFLELIQNRFAIYPYFDGFFITLKVNDNQQRDEVFNQLIDNHVYTVKVNKGLRIAICSLSLKQIPMLVDKVALAVKNA